jgi:hypothetical protein
MLQVDATHNNTGAAMAPALAGMCILPGGLFMGLALCAALSGTCPRF